MKPGRERRLTAELTDSAERSEKGFLRQILGLSWVFGHAEAKGIDAWTMLAVEPFKSGSVALLYTTQRFTFCQSGLRLHRMERSFLHTPGAPPANTRRFGLVAPRRKVCCNSKIRRGPKK